MRSTRLFAAMVALFSGAACTESTVSRDQVVLDLTHVDGRPLPAPVEAAAGTNANVIVGRLAGSPSQSTCDYVVRYTLANILSDAVGTVSECRLEAGDDVTLNLDLGGPPGPVGTHAYRFQY